MSPGLNRTPGPGQRQQILATSAAETARTGRRPFGETLRTLLDRGDPAAQWYWQDPPGRAYAGREPHGQVPTLELTADPAHPGAARALAALLRESLPHAGLWAHGDGSQARLAAEALGLHPQRRLLLLVRDLSDPPPAAPPRGVEVRPFDAARDAARWLALNRAAFQQLPDQGSWDAADLQRRLAADWFDPAGFVIAENAGRMLGFHWTKVDATATVDGAPSGEVYVIAVAPEAQGTGVAAALLAAGLEHLAARGLTRVHLFVDDVNQPAVRRYTAAGFQLRDTDRFYRW